jgi:acetate kinase
MKILIPNLGSTSLKWRLFDFAHGEARVLHKGGFERVTNYAQAVGDCLAQLKETGALADERELAAIGFKTIIAKGVTGCVYLDENVLRAMEAYNDLAPAHNPPYITGIRLFAKRMPDVPLIALFETAFYQFAPDAMMRYAVPQPWHDAGIRRWGFHGASHKYIAERSADLLGRPDIAERTRQLYVSERAGSARGPRGSSGSPRPELVEGREDSESSNAGARANGGGAPLRVISCHLGGSSSITGILNGVAIGNSLGMSPQSGLPQNNRVGDLDSAAVPYAMRALGLSLEEAERQLTQESGLKGLSGLSNDIRDLQDAARHGHPGATLALDVFVASARHWIGAYFLELNGADAVVFTAGIGENAADLRDRICANLDAVGLVLDAERNAATRAREGVISAADSRVKVLVIPTNEELVVAREARRLLVSRHNDLGGHLPMVDNLTSEVVTRD